MKFINKYLRNLSPYKVASHKVWEVSNDKRKELLKLDWNEASVPPSPKVKERLLTLVEQDNNYSLYPSTYNDELLQRLSMYCNLPIDNIQYFASSDSLHEYLVRMYINVGDPILILGPSYDNFRLTSQSQGAIVHYFNYNDDFLLDKGLLKENIQKVSPSLVYICNPNNPTGNLISRDIIKDLLETFPDTIFLIDEAYYEFSQVTVSDLVVDHPNLFISRTFSKAFALANFRAGYLISDTNNIQQISKIRNPKNFTTFAQEAVIAVLSDVNYMKNYVKEVGKAKVFFYNFLKQIPFVKKAYPSSGNFILIDFKNFESKMLIFNLLSENDIFVRNLTHSSQLTNSLRITIGTLEQMERVANVLQKYTNN